MRPQERLIGSLFFLYIGEEEKVGGGERLPKPPQRLPTPPQSLPKVSPNYPKASPDHPRRKPAKFSAISSEASWKQPFKSDECMAFWKCDCSHSRAISISNVQSTVRYAKKKSWLLPLSSHIDFEYAKCANVAPRFTKWIPRFRGSVAERAGMWRKWVHGPLSRARLTHAPLISSNVRCTQTPSNYITILLYCYITVLL